MTKYFLSPSARIDLIDIWTYIADHKRILSGFRDIIELLD